METPTYARQLGEIPSPLVLNQSALGQYGQGDAGHSHN